MTQMNRREMMVAAAATACACCLGNPLRVLAANSSEPFDAGPLSAFSKDGVTDTWMPNPNDIALVRHEGKLYAMTTVCTHRGGIIKIDPAGGGVFTCPRHHAGFDIDGNVTHGPAKTPLDRYKISVNAAGHVIVDKNTTYGPDKWTDPNSFIAIK